MRARSSARRASSGGTATTTSSSSRAGATTPTRTSARSAARALRLSLSAFQRLLAPFLPFVCEEVWSWWQEGSVHRAPWPDAAQLLAASGESAEREREDLALDVTADVLREVRKAKSQAQRKMRAAVTRVSVHDTAERLDALELGEGRPAAGRDDRAHRDASRRRSSRSRSSSRRRLPSSSRPARAGRAVRSASV